MKKSMVMFGLLWVLIGCSSGRPDQSGPAIEVYPVLTSLALQTNRQQLAKAQTRLDDFLHEQHAALVTQQIVLYWHTPDGERFAIKTRQKLRSLGVASEQLRLEKSSNSFGQHFDFKVDILAHKVVVPVCPYAQVSRFGQEGTGCFIESSRWQSMVNPQKMLQSESHLQHGSR